MACPEEQAFVDLVEGRLADLPRDALHSHAGSCVACGLLLTTLARTVLPEGPTLGEHVGHYRLDGVLGRGGMGVVHRAFDEKLRRVVAIKFLSPGLMHDEHARARLEREARASAALDHPHVGGIYEIGAHEGAVFLVMPLFDGGTLKERLASPPLPLAVGEARRILTELVSALAAAHQAGIVHRDVKPGNIMLTAGGVRLVDFGLAKLSDATATLSTTGQLVGTPAYMAPEQFEGQCTAAADVWAVGALAYELLTGRPPFVAPSVAALHLAVRTEEPKPMGRAEVPRDLETIVLACLEKDATRRYPSAVELLADLQRLDDAQPVRARRFPVRTLGRRLRRVRFSALLIAATLTLITTALLMRRAASERAARAQRFTREADELRALMREAHLLPLHDTRPERAEVRRRMQSVADELAKLGSAAAATGHYALGAGDLALGDFAPAQRELQLAWSAGERTPEAAFLLGFAGSQLYHAAVVEAHELPPTARAAREKELEKTLRDPALERLRDGATAESRDLVDALVALDEHRYTAALPLAQRAFAAAPRRYEAGAVVAEAQSALAGEKWRAGDRPGALAWFDRAAATYNAVNDIARSDDRMYEEAAGQLHDSLALQREQGLPPNDLLNRLVTLWKRAQTADPDRWALVRGEADAEWMIGNSLSGHGGAWEPHVRRALALAESVVAHAPDDWRADLVLGTAWSDVGDLIKAQASDASARALAANRQAVRLHPSFWTHAVLSTALAGEARAQVIEGGSAVAPVVEARHELEAALAIEPTDAPSLYNLGDLLGLEAEERDAAGQDASPLFSQAIVVLARASALDHSDPDAHSRAAAVRALRAQATIRRGQDATDDLTSARQELDAAVKLDPTRVELWRVRTTIDRVDAQRLIRRHLDPSVALARARADVAQLAAGWGAQADESVWSERGFVELQAARAALGRGGDPTAALKQATADAETVTRGLPHYSDGWLAVAEAALYRARQHRRAQRPFADDAHVGLRALDHVKPELRAGANALRALLAALLAPGSPDAQAATAAANPDFLHDYD